MGLSRFRSAVTLLPDFLNLVKHLRLNDRRVGVVEDSAVFCWILSLLLIPNGIRVIGFFDSSFLRIMASKDTGCF